MRCPTDFAVFLIAVPDSKGVLRFPSGQGEYGLVVPVKPLQLMPDLARETWSRWLQQSGYEGDSRVEFISAFSAQIEVQQGPATLYIARAQGDMPFAHTLEPLPMMLRRMPAERIRLAYLRAWQILQGGLSASTKAVSTDNMFNLIRDSDHKE